MTSKSSKRSRRSLSAGASRAMLRDIFEAKHDLSGLCEQYSLSPEQLSAWASDAEHRTVLQGLCVLADLQTQLMLSRYRQLAVGELIRQATGEDEKVSPEQARKACVDLLRADLKVPGGGGQVVDDALSASEERDGLSALRDAIFGDAEGMSDKGGGDS